MVTETPPRAGPLGNPRWLLLAEEESGEQGLVSKLLVLSLTKCSSKSVWRSGRLAVLYPSCASDAWQVSLLLILLVPEGLSRAHGKPHQGPCLFRGLMGTSGGRQVGWTMGLVTLVFSLLLTALKWAP